MEYEYEYDNVSINTIYLNEEDFEELKNDGLILGILKDQDEKYALSVINYDEAIIFINSEEFNELSKTEKKIVFAHELAHVYMGILDDEEADKWAMEFLDDDCKKVLKEEWKHRHGHSYKEPIY